MTPRERNLGALGLLPELFALLRRTPVVLSIFRIRVLLLSLSSLVFLLGQLDLLTLEVHQLVKLLVLLPYQGVVDMKNGVDLVVALLKRTPNRPLQR